MNGNVALESKDRGFDFLQEVEELRFLHLVPDELLTEPKMYVLTLENSLIKNKLYLMRSWVKDKYLFYLNWISCMAFYQAIPNSCLNASQPILIIIVCTYSE